MSQSSRGARCVFLRHIASPLPLQAARRTTAFSRSASLIRAFTSSPSRKKHGALATFPETSQPELNALLSSIRSNIFLPSHLLTPQKSLIYRPRHRASLLPPSNPVLIDLSPSQSVPLAPINRLADEPSLRKSIPKMLNLLKTSTEKRDWDFLPSFLEEMKISRRKLSPERWERLVRVANEKGRSDVIVEACWRGVGVAIGDLRVGRQVMWGPLLLATQGGWKTNLVEKALRQAEEVLDLMEAEVRQRRKTTKTTDVLDVASRPEVLAVPLALASVSVIQNAKSEPANAEEDQSARKREGVKKVAIYTRRMMANWPQLDLSDPYALAAVSSSGKNATRAPEKENLDLQNHILQVLSPILLAARAALVVLKDGESEKEVEWLQTHVEELEQRIETARAELGAEGEKGKRRIGLVWSEEMILPE